MVELAANFGKEPVPLKEVAKSQEISEKYLGQIVIELKSAGLIDGFRGASGGYMLAKPPSKITLKDIVGIFEDDLTLLECTRNPAACQRISFCASREVWQKLGAVMAQTLEAISLNDLLVRQQDKLEQPVMYCI